MTARGRRSALALALVAGLAGAARANELDPTRLLRFSVEAPRLAARTSVTPLASELEPAWRVRVAGGILHAPVTRDDGSVLVPQTHPSLAAYGADGRLLWAARLGAAPAADSPIVLGDGTVLVLTEAADAIWLSPRGKLLRQVSLPLSTLERPPAIAALGSGAVLIAEGRRLVRLDAAGTVTYKTRLDEDVAAVLGDPGDPVLAMVSGAVLSLSPDGRLSRRGTLGGRVDALARLDARRLAAVVDGRRLAELDLATEALTMSLSDPNLELSSQLAGNARGELRLLAAGDWLLAFHAGREQFRAALPTAGGLPQKGAPAELLLDPRGSALVVRANADALLVAPDGALGRIDGTACPEPLRPSASRGGGAVLACRSGVLAGLRPRPRRQ